MRWLVKSPIGSMIKTPDREVDDLRAELERVNTFRSTPTMYVELYVINGNFPSLTMKHNAGVVDHEGMKQVPQAAM